METTTKPSLQPEIKGPDCPESSDHNHHCHHQHDHDDQLIAELESLRQSFKSLQSRCSAAEENLRFLRHERDEAIDRNEALTRTIEEVSIERDSLRDKVGELEASVEDTRKESERSRERIQRFELEYRERDEVLSTRVDSIRECFFKITEGLDDGDGGADGDSDEKAIEERTESRLDETPRAIWEDKLVEIERIARNAGAKVSEYKESRTKEKRELENSVVSLTEENRDVNKLLRVALVEKEAVEKKLKGSSSYTEQKRVPLLQRVGFGFMMGVASTEPENLVAGTAAAAAAASSSSKSDSSECEEEVVSLVCMCSRFTVFFA